MGEVSTMGLDIAKSVFQIHGVDDDGAIFLRKTCKPFGGKERLGRISKQGNRHLRWLLVAGAMAVIRHARQHGAWRLWVARIMARRPRFGPYSTSL
jgi:transposase